MIKKLVVGALLLAPCLVAAEEAAVLETVVVTATRSEQPEVRLPAAVSVVTAEQIAASGAIHLVDVLRSLGTAQVTDLYGDGSRAQIDLRGFGDAANANTLILVDGRRLNNPDIAAPDLNSIALKDIARIEILHGSAGALYGDQAVGGVIHIITRAAPASTAGVEFGAGSYDSSRALAVGSLLRGPFSARLSAEARRSDNYRDHNDLRYLHLLGRGGYAWADGAAFLEGAWTDEDLLTPGALFEDELRADRRQSAPRFANDYSDTDTRVLRLGLEQALGKAWTLNAEASERRSDGSFRLGSFGLATQDSAQDRRVRALTPRLNARYPLARGALLLTLGSDLQRADYTLSSQFGTQSNRQDLADVYGQAIVPLASALDLTLGLRHARVDNAVVDGFTFTERTRFGDSRSAAQAGLSWQPLAQLRLFAGYDRNFRFAKVDEFTNAGAAPGANVNLLRTQTGDSYEAGAQWQAGGHHLRVTLYRMALEDEIVFDPTTFSNVNLERTRRDGLTLDARWQVLPSLALGAGAQYVDAQIRDGRFAGNPVPLVARRSGRLSAELRLPQGFAAYAELLATGARSFAGDYDKTLDELPGHAVTNVALGWQRQRLALHARLNNVFGREYSEYGAAGTDPATFAEAPAYQPSPERNFSLTLRYGF